MRIFSVLLIVGAGFLGLAACGDDSSGGSGGSGGSAGGAPSAGYCAKPCAAPADCCAMGVPNCPGAYPNNWTCDNGVCGAPQCATDADCSFGGAVMGYKCLTKNGFNSCLPVCSTDSDCTPLTCIGTDDNGAKYCTTTTPAGSCKTDADCGGSGKCNTATGGCECTADAECMAPGFSKCVL